MVPLIIDVEASGFGRGSYPIEVGFVLPGGETHCVIIRPHDDWQHWDKTAEALHGINRDILLEHGREPLEVAHYLNYWLGGKVVYSDAWGNDRSWLALLFECVGVCQHFRIEALRSLMSEAQAACWHRVKQSVITEYGYRRHRASQDALILQQTFVQSSQKEAG